MNKPLVYLCGPIAGKSLYTMQAWRCEATVALAHNNIGVLDPLRGKSDADIQTFLEAGTPLNSNVAAPAIVQRDKTDVMRCDCVLAYLNSENRVSIGSMFELAWAHLLNKPIVVVLPLGPNVHRHLFVLQTAGWLVTSLSAALLVIEELFPSESL